MGRAQPAHRLGLRSVSEGPLLMLLPNDALVQEIKKKSQPREKLARFRHAWAKYWGYSPMATLKNGGSLLLGAQRAARPVIPAPSPPAKRATASATGGGKAAAWGNRLFLQDFGNAELA